jgi:hypothetical protein
MMRERSSKNASSLYYDEGKGKKRKKMTAILVNMLYLFTVVFIKAQK